MSVWIRYSHSHGMYPFSYAVPTNANEALAGYYANWEFYINVRPTLRRATADDGAGSHIVCPCPVFGRTSSLQGEGWQASTTANYNDGQWHNYAMRWRSFDGHFEFFIDATSLAYRTGFAMGAVLEQGGTLTVGQEQDCTLGCFDGNQAIDGDVAELLWYNAFAAKLNVGRGVR